MKWRDLMRHLSAHGCEVIREGSKHTVVCNPANSRTSTVPRHRQIDDFLARKICRDLGVPDP
ncbi:type II toxin-antitoxin system HicA family toxin [Candidatus Poribacteria bacterium]|nr:type II toxin-antitoxin system HicA family toxin [Candidatus Poribacteria bacterium]